MCMTWLFETDASGTRFAQRLALAAVIIPHGAQKLLGWFGGYGFEGTMAFLTGKAGLPWIVALLVVLIESMGSIALVFGFLSRLSALGIAAVMVGAILTAHLGNGFFMNWSGQQAGEGFEYHLLALALAVPVVVAGGGRHAVDGAIARALRARAGRRGRGEAGLPAHAGA
jgi:putative oxidoreductase